MNFEIDEATRDRLEMIRERGRSEVRPIGLEADRLGRPIPVEDPYFARLIERGEGRTRWPGPEPGEKKKGGGAKKSGRGPSQVTVMSLLFVEELAYWDRGVMVANPGVGLPEGNVLAMGTEGQKERFLGPFLKPDRPRWACFAMTEPGAGSDAAAIQTTARKDGDGWILNGAKCFIGNASRSDWILVQATLDPAKGRSAQRAFFVEQGTPGLGGMRIEKKMGLKAYESTSFTLQDCRIPAAGRLQECDEGLQCRAPHRGRKRGGDGKGGPGRVARLCAGSRPAGRRAHARSARAGRAQAQDGPPARAGWLADQQKPNIVEASMSKAVAAEVGMETTSLGMELLGTVGARGDHLIEKLYRDVKAMDMVEGTGQIQRIIMARKLVDLPRE
jgi:acyl-CoA dehydrogenase